jgi:DNA-binding protein H-NS
MSLEELLEQHRLIEQQLVAAREREAEIALADIVRTMQEYKISLAELIGKKDTKEPASSTAKYRDPVTGATWSGRGRAPRWIAGKDRDDFLIDRQG